MTISVVIPQAVEQLDEVRRLFRSFTEWHRQRRTEDVHLIDQ